MATAIEVDRLTKTFQGKTAVNDISFSIDQGQVVGFLGPNGAGKTTTIRMLTCFMPATSGRASVMGFDVFEQSIQVRQRIGYLPEATPVYPEMRVEEYLEYRARLKGVGRSELNKAVGDAMERTQIRDVRRRIIGQLSKGYRQRVGLADALVATPPILILDEPTIGLDPNQIRETRQLIRELGEDHTVFLSTHILPEVEQVCDRVVIIHKGEIGGEGTPAELRDMVSGGVRLKIQARGQHPSLVRKDLEKIEGVTEVAFTGSIIGGEYEKAPSLLTKNVEYPEEAILEFDVVAEKDEAVREDIFFAAVDGEWVIRELKTESLSLEQVFAFLTSQEVETSPSKDLDGDDEDDEGDEVGADEGKEAETNDDDVAEADEGDDSETVDREV